MELLNYDVLKKSGYRGYILEAAPEKVMQFGEGNFLRAFVNYWFDISNEKAGWNGKCVLIQPIAQGLTEYINKQEGLYMISIIVLDLFGRRCFHKTLALTTSLFTVGQALNTPLLNVPYDFMGNYMISFVVSMVASVIIIVAFNASMISLKADAKNEKPVIEISKTH